MEVVHERVAGLDVHNRLVTQLRRLGYDVQIQQRAAAA
jgi:hypothetical protein